MYEYLQLIQKDCIIASMYQLSIHLCCYNSVINENTFIDMCINSALACLGKAKMTSSVLHIHMFIKYK